MVKKKKASKAREFIYTGRNGGRYWIKTVGYDEDENPIQRRVYVKKHGRHAKSHDSRYGHGSGIDSLVKTRRK